MSSDRGRRGLAIAIAILAAAMLLIGAPTPSLADLVLDPVGFCPPPATVTTCTTGTGLSGETIAVGSTQFGMFKNGQGTSIDPWFLLVAIPDYTGPFLPITSNSFTLVGTPASFSPFLPTTPGDIYAFTGTSPGDNSMNAANMFFGGQEQAAFGSIPAFFDIFRYDFTPGFLSGIGYSFSVGDGGLPAGTFLAAAGGSNPFTTPFTITGLVTGGGGSGGSGGLTEVPGPGSLVLLGLGVMGVGLTSWGYNLRRQR